MPINILNLNLYFLVSPKIQGDLTLRWGCQVVTNKVLSSPGLSTQLGAPLVAQPLEDLLLVTPLVSWSRITECCLLLEQCSPCQNAEFSLSVCEVILTLSHWTTEWGVCYITTTNHWHKHSTTRASPDNTLFFMWIPSAAGKPPCPSTRILPIGLPTSSSTGLLADVGIIHLAEYFTSHLLIR